MKEQEEQDRHLQAPTEANRDKHINFTALERGEQDPADEKENDSKNAVYTNNDAAQQQIEKDLNSPKEGEYSVSNKETNQNPSAVYTTENSTEQSPQEHEHDKSVDPDKNDKKDIDPGLPLTDTTTSWKE